MRIGIIIGRIGDVDGVALETEKWIEVLNRMGHDIFVLCGTSNTNIIPKKDITIWSGLSFFSPECEWEQKRAFYFPDSSPRNLMNHLDRTSERIATKIFKWVLSKNIDLIIAENNLALPCHLSMGVGIRRALEKVRIPVISHDHDFYWERGGRYYTPHREIRNVIKKTFPLNLSNVKHAVINSYSKRELKKRLGVDSVVVPNVMDFDKPFGTKDNYNENLLGDLGIKKDEIPLFQITRIVERKGIETAIELVNVLNIKNKKRIKLVITGSSADDERNEYYKFLANLIKSFNIEKDIIFADKIILRDRLSNSISPIYSLSDAYANAVACTYFSKYEGFGNAFLESVIARKPIFVNNYKPVYWEDIGCKGFKVPMMEDNQLGTLDIDYVYEIITNPKLQKEISDFNFDLGKKYFSYGVLEKKLEELICSFY